MPKLTISPAVIRKAVKRLVIAAGIIAVTGFLLLPAILRPILEKKITEAIHRKAAIRSVYINPFTLSAALRGVVINQRDSPEVMLSFDEFYVNVQSLSVVKGGLIISSVRLVRPTVNLTRNKDQSYNFSDLLAAAPPKPKEEKKQEPFKFSINNIEVVNGSVDFFDMPKNVRHTIRDLNIAVPFLSNLPYYLSSYVEPSFRATVNGTVIAFRGKTLPFAESLETTVDVDLKGVNLPYYLAYSPVPLRFRLLSGLMDVQCVVSFQQFKERAPRVSVKGTVALRNIRLADMQKKPLVEIALFSVSLLPSDLMAKAVHFSDISLNAPKIYVERGRSGELNLLQAFVPEKSAAGDKPDRTPAEASSKEASSLPVIDIDALAVRDGKVLFTDRLPAAAQEPEAAGPEPVKFLVDNILLQGGSLSTREKVKGTLKLSLNINRTGLLRTAGALGLTPLDLDTSVEVGNIPLAALQPYVAQEADLLLADGRFSLKGKVRVRFSAGKAKGLTADFRGSTSLSRLAVRDGTGSNELLSWKELRFDRIEAELNPLAVKIKTIALGDLFAGIVVEEDGLLNLQKIAKKAPDAVANPAPEQPKPSAPDAPAEAAAAGPATSPNITIGQVLLTNGRVSFIDNHVKPKYAASLAGIDVKVSGLSSKEDLTADLLLHATFDQYAPLAVAGKINPLRKELFLDVKTDFKDLELSTLTPYSGTYIGRAVEKGKLSFSLQYHIARKKLDAKNEIFIDQLTLGEKIDSPKATGLPVGLAIALLKNRKGEIRLDIPVTGEIDKPEFSVGKIILQVLVNLLVKAATSPFALLGSMMGGEDLGYVEFDYGSAAVAAENAKKIDALADALYDRPELKLEVTGYVDPAKDGEALRSARMKSLLVAQKVKDLSSKGEQPAASESAEITAAEYPVYLKKAYKSGKFPKPRNFFGMAKDIPDAEMEQLLLASIRVTDDDLRQLGLLRARTVKEDIVKTQKVEPNRVFLLEPKSMTPEQKEHLRDSRVDFSLK